MASREDLAIIRAARAGQAPAQLALGKRYLSGGHGLPQSLPTAMHWLERAARSDQAEAWRLIGSHIPYELALQATDIVAFSAWYERAFDEGLATAGLVFAKLALTQPALQGVAGLRTRAIKILQVVAQSGAAEAQWLLAQHVGSDLAPLTAREATADRAAVAAKTADTMIGQTAAMPANAMAEDGVHAIDAADGARSWAERAADAGVTQAQYASADAAWSKADLPGYLRRALPLARALWTQYATRLLQLNMPSAALAQQLGQKNLLLLSRCCQALLQGGVSDSDDRIDEVQQFWELAAYADDKAAQFSLGLSYARMQADGARSEDIAGSANYKKAIRWLTLAGEGGLAAAWYALSRIFLKPEFSQRSLADAQYYLERAAEMGHAAAQLECGVGAWRNRRDQLSNDVKAVYWLQKAAAQGSVEAVSLLEKITDAATPVEWAERARQYLTRAAANAYPFLAARIELAVLFGLTQPEALLININEADRDHCLVVDIRADYARSKRRLIPVVSAEQRAALHRIGRLFEDVDCGAHGLEGNYRQRLYRLKTLVSQAEAAELVAQAALEATLDR
jgi:TPR repeat protein